MALSCQHAYRGHLRGEIYTSVWGKGKPGGALQNTEGPEGEHWVLTETQLASGYSGHTGTCKKIERAEQNLGCL